ncbi:MAG: T9SS type A sorting domain-containing protein [Bacteroidetes bacterium]|nr:T9SS type A sorting domain-containing protein [Bacteroidota bacterium]
MHAQETIVNGRFNTWDQTQFKVPTKWMVIGSATLDSSKTAGNSRGIKLSNSVSDRTISYALEVGAAYPNVLNGGYPISGTPTSIKINYNSSALGKDTAVVIVGFTKGVDPMPMILQQFYLFADASGSGDNSITVPLTYFHVIPGLVADSAFIYIASSAAAGTPNSSGSISIYNISFPDGKTATTANLDFESWGGLSVLKPASWYTSLDAYEEKVGKIAGIQQFALQTTSARTGYALILKQRPVVMQSGTEILPSWLITQNPSYSVGAMDLPSFTVDKRFMSLRGYWKGSLATGDRVSVMVNFFDADTLVGSAMFSQNSTATVPANYSLFAENIIWVPGYMSTPQKATVGAFLTDSTFQLASAAASVIYLEDLSLDINSARVNPVQTNVGLTLFPNPTDGDFTIRATQQIKRVSMINTLGQLVYQTEVDGLNEVRCSIPAGESKLLWVVIEGDGYVITKGISIK